MQSVAVPASCNHGTAPAGFSVCPRERWLPPSPCGSDAATAGRALPPQARSLPPVSRLQGSHSCWSEHAGSLQSPPLVFEAKLRQSCHFSPGLDGEFGSREIGKKVLPC
ncbi:hypothetical protein NDU88_000134 [Pleurodeles waltl]|uniref:Uncharacterized protein n=1 Tax=Pleurodeles waltl TaxID=8319 RepID=A0AAV7V4A4_PLEWA|nr:hypothetical protein NDU88_000134 [Pleurodeles waltl]